ncbi:MAG TPA: NADH-quinone oxidoreductase subunit A [Planctomycetes bacterium]|nr:NADH-quinone oxidoreductase subunit A [Planctomycetota bacterium]
MYFHFFNLGVFLLLGAVAVFAMLLVGAFLRPKRPGRVKEDTYECGILPEGEGWIRFDMRFYTVALIFLVFDIEIAFLFPWARVFEKLGAVALVEGFIFVLILLVGLFYVWAAGDLAWVKSVGEEEPPAGKEEKA